MHPVCIIAHAIASLQTRDLEKWWSLSRPAQDVCSKAQRRINPCRTLSPALPLMLLPGDMSKQSLVERSPPAKTTKAISHPWQCLEQKRHSGEPQEGCKSGWRQSSVGKLPMLCCLLGAFLSAFGASSPSLLKAAHSVNAPHWLIIPFNYRAWFGCGVDVKTMRVQALH